MIYPGYGIINDFTNCITGPHSCRDEDGVNPVCYQLSRMEEFSARWAENSGYSVFLIFEKP